MKKLFNNEIIAPLLLVFLHLFLLLNLQFTAWPEMQLWPYLILKGWKPYSDIAIAHNPLLLLGLSAFNLLFGTGLLQLKIYTFISILFLDVLLYWVAKKVWNTKAALFALAFFIPLQVYYEGNGLWFDLWLALPALASYYYLVRKKYLKSGIFWAVSFFVKQTAVWFLIPIAIYLLQEMPYKKLIKRASRFFTGILIITLPILLTIWALGVLPSYIFWAYNFGVGILPRAAGQISFPDSFHAVRALGPLVLLLFLARDLEDSKNTNLLAWTIAGFMGTFPRWELFHFQPALPFLAISASLVATQIKKYSYLAKSFFVLVLCANILLFSRFLFRQWGQDTRFFEKDIVEVSEYVKGDVKEGSKIFVANTWDSLYVMTQTLPATKPWIPQLPWYLNLPGVEEEMVSDLKDTFPEIVVLKPYTKTGLSSYKPGLISQFLEDNYVSVAEVGGHVIYKEK